MRCSDPVVARNEATAKKYLKVLLTIVIDNIIISDSTADKAEHEYLKFCSECIKKDEMINYSRHDSRIDIFWKDLFKGFTDMDAINSVMKIIMTLFYGNTNVERVFSINLEYLVENI